MTQPEAMVRFAREAMALSSSVPIEVTPLAGRGSDRAFFRVTWDRRDSAIVIHYDAKRLENSYYADIARFLRDIHVPVPLVYGHDRQACLLIMEDLGNQDLWSLRESSWETRQVFYRKTLTVLHRLHGFPEKAFPADRIRLMDGFDARLYQWERDYFREHFVGGVCGIRLEASLNEELEAELAALAGRLAGTGRCLVHRDLQSQNVMIRDEEPYLIDFQGMRFGSPFYDLGSLLCDPYVDFSDGEREELLFFYYGLSARDLDWQSFRNCFWEASAQRLMQALGAYGFLGLKKGLTPFLAHIPAGLGNLLRAASSAPALTRLRDLARRCRKKMGQNREFGTE